MDGRTRRKLRCDKHGHQFNTEEKRIGWRLDEDVHLRRAGKISASPFDPEFLTEDVRRAVLGRASEASIRDVVDAVVGHLRYSVVLKEAEPLTGAAYEQVASARRINHPITVIDEEHVAKAVENRLKDRGNRLAHVLYALASRGRFLADSANWKTAEHVLQWLFDEYDDLRTPIPPRPETARHQWLPVRPATLPKFVVKRSVDLDFKIADREQHELQGIDDEGQLYSYPTTLRDRAVVRFIESRFHESVEAALYGRQYRHGEIDTTHLATYVTWWVLHDLQGQSRVTSAQLGIGVLDCLRRVDEIAYLRWATQRKDFRSVRDFRDEAIALVEYPSTQLQFAPAPPNFRDEIPVGPTDGEKGPLHKDLFPLDTIEPVNDS
ncbi:hypothetical protein I549_4312 [Mycobacterium avium subsp. avium 2285 (R)]|nr:hypothetical protein I549_4312 [Mycobacterium avium subsp. avium 2285 (R)]